ncbi:MULTISPECIES: acetyl-CoA C-acyltransferase [Modicisalibacter]|uniref:Acetyl-CoA C-acyltransferase n=1 Tax=Modicisalibacter tunisiensis TaxID=390637 RepID=A0ABS7X1P7_9GAMM|nr:MULTISPECIES: acetyl-CoA C-acyltransferase [Modicisalibacter]KXS39588.1 MAG: acetyl-CoA C-acetyltransferase [Halomonadaceae bacterium T82-2]MBZ9537768.1 acetyl-CoA C-acyltransferase [Modicisalibacter tunisiensis]MBZ9568813.1 acetyl-CoA C-acyltransferase [Modicisalibacter tunisiensis]
MNAADEIVILSGARTPMGSLLGSLSSISAPELGAVAVRGAIERAGVEPGEIDEGLMGCVLPAGLGQGPARQALRRAGVPDACGATTVNKLCGSGMKAAMLAHDLLRAGSGSLVVAGGMESMSNAPHLLPGARAGYRLGHGALKDHLFLDGLEDAESGRLMGAFAQQVADDRGYSRERMDDFAIASLERAMAADRHGELADEIVPVSVTSRQGTSRVEQDEQPFSAKLERIRSLRPAFGEHGTITAANASSISDGASALLLARRDAAEARGLTPQARILGHATHSRHPSEFTLAPVGAVGKLLERLDWHVDDVDLFEINEAFAVVTLIAMDELNLPHERVNVFGGACAQGHPIGSSGSRILVTLLNALRRRGGRRGIASLCIGGGEATAVAIERLD